MRVKSSIFYLTYIHIKFSLDGCSIYYSQQSNINYCDIRQNKLIYKDTDVNFMSLKGDQNHNIFQIDEVIRY